MNVPVLTCITSPICKNKFDYINDMSAIWQLALYCKIFYKYIVDNEKNDYIKLRNILYESFNI